MDELEKIDKGVKLAAFLLQLIAFPFVIITFIGAISVLFVPLSIVDNSHSNTHFLHMLGIYVFFLALVVVGYVVSASILMMSEMMIDNQQASNNRRTPKARMYQIVDNSLIILGLDLAVGGILGFPIALTRVYSVREEYQLRDAHMFLAVVFLAGVLVYFIRKYLMNLSWWREP